MSGEEPLPAAVQARFKPGAVVRVRGTVEWIRANSPGSTNAREVTRVDLTMRLKDAKLTPVAAAKPPPPKPKPRGSRLFPTEEE